MASQTKCKKCEHESGKCDCMCCGSILKSGCLTCIIPTLVYRGIMKLKEKKTE